MSNPRDLHRPRLSATFPTIPDRRRTERRVRFDADTGEVYINGKPIGAFMHEDGPTFERLGRGATLVHIPLMVIASEVTMTGNEGSPLYDRLVRDYYYEMASR